MNICVCVAMDKSYKFQWVWLEYPLSVTNMGVRVNACTINFMLPYIESIKASLRDFGFHFDSARVYKCYDNMWATSCTKANYNQDGHEHGTYLVDPI